MENLGSKEKSHLVILRRKQVEQRTGLSRSTIYSKPSFPKPIKLGLGSAVGWIESEINDWLEAQIKASRKEVG